METMMTSKQKKQILRVVEDELDKLSASKNGAQSVLSQGDKLQAGFRNLVENLVNSILKLISAGEKIFIDAVDGSETILDAKDMFGYIDSDFKGYGADEAGPATKVMPVDVYEMAKDATFAQMFGSLSSDLNALCLTQAQIKNFVRKHRNWLRTDGYGTFFLFKSKNNFFVANVLVHSDGTLRVHVYQLGYSVVWYAVHRHRVVAPQLA